RVFANVVGIACARTVIELHVVPFAPVQLPQGLHKTCNAGPHFRIVRGEGGSEQTNPPHPLALLRARSERPRDCPAAEQRDELATLHRCNHSITSSARASTVAGTSRPSAFLRLITSKPKFDLVIIAQRFRSPFGRVLGAA